VEELQTQVIRRLRGVGSSSSVVLVSRFLALQATTIIHKRGQVHIKHLFERYVHNALGGTLSVDIHSVDRRGFCFSG
jgi:hypothetical protein